ncbi:MAG: serine--tRNA ligase, partial [Deltaproteobacteria bacterium]|nr:serine--tRNA ligase [Deltaproteobacteria bacterium]
VPDGATDADNVETRKWGTIPEFGFAPRDHLDLGTMLDIVDIERGVKVAGSRNYFLKGDGMRLQHAVLQLALDLLHRKGYTLMDPPHVVSYQAMMGTSYFPGGEENAYHLDERDNELYLIGTSEVPVCSYHTEEILELNSLPRRYAGYSPCYRREAGTYGKDTRGLYRIHQFYKVEQVVLCEASADSSRQMHAELLGNAEELLQMLKIPYRVVDVCTGDMGQGQVYKNDIESWMPSRNGYGETHSCSSFYEFQSRRLNIRYKDAQGRNRLCHTLNNTLIASPRILIPLLELNQQADGSVRIPEPLRPYMGGQEMIVPPVRS